MKFEKHQYRPNDPVYFGRQHYEQPKESFKLVTKLIRDAHGEGPLSLVDAGCATGAFLAYARTQLELPECVGFDIAEEHLEQARRHVPGVEFVADSILALERLRGRRFDVCTCVGALAIFDDLETALRGLLALRKPTGSVFVYDIVNDHPVDMLMRFRRVDGPAAAEWQPGLNVWSGRTYERVVAEIDPQLRTTFTDVEMPFPLEYREPMRAWTIATERRPHQLVVGTNQLLDFKVVRIFGP